MSLLFQEKGAKFSPCERYRYELWRQWQPGPPNKLVFIGLNPSTADALVDDPTIRRCISFAKLWGYNGFTMLNLFAWRATDPEELLRLPLHRDPVGPDNNDTLGRHLRQFGVQVIAAWGNDGTHMNREAVAKVLAYRAGVRLWCLGTTKAGLPRHPLYVRGDTKPIPYFTP